MAAILPFLAIITDPGMIDTQPYLAALRDWMQPEDTQQFLFQFGIGVFLLIVCGTIFKLFTMYALARFSHMRKYHISQRMLAGYLRQPYAWFLSNHSSNLVKSLVTEVDQMVGAAMVPAMKILSQMVTVVLLLGLLIFVEPVAAIGAIVLLGGSYITIFFVVRRRLKKLGEDRVRANTGRFRIANEALGGIKDVKLLGIEESCKRNFRPYAWLHATTLVRAQVIGELPRYGLEALTFGSMIALVLFLLASADGAMTAVLPVLGLFAMAGLRLLPAIQNIYHSATVLGAAQAVMNLVHDQLMTFEKGLADLPPPSTEHLPFKDRIELRNAHFTYSGVSQPVLRGLDLEIPAKSTVGIVGGTGAGKTTAIDVLMGLLILDEGQVCVDGQEITRDRLRAWQNTIGYVPQQIFLSDDTVAANIAFGIPKDKIDMEAVERSARLARLHDFVTEDLEHGYEQEVGERGVRLSGGQRQRIGIARALYHDPEVLVLDEATSALDNITESAIMEAMHTFSRSKTIIMIAHRLSTVEDCDNIFLLERGRCVAQGTYQELLAKSALFRAMARVEEEPPQVAQ
ncbi:MAG: ABC transporter ATP-binding protein [Pseudomonadota bacterium]